MLKIKANYEQERRSIVAALVESGYKVRLEREIIRHPQREPNELSLLVPRFDSELEHDIYIIVEEVPENELCKVIG